MTCEWEIIPQEYEKPVQGILRRIRGIVGNMWKCRRIEAVHRRLIEGVCDGSLGAII